MISLFNSLFLKLGLISIFLLNSCIHKESFKSIISSQEIITKELTLNSFEKIKVSNSCDVEVILGNTFKIEYSDYENVIDDLIFEVKENELQVSSKKTNDNKFSNSVAKAKIFVNKNLNEITVSGSGDIKITDKNTTPNLKCSIFGSGNINIERVENQYADLIIFGSGDVNIKNGNIKNANCTISGSGSIDLMHVKTIQAKCKISGSGVMELNVLSELEGDISGSGSIKYMGNPKIRRNISGSGEIIPFINIK